MATPTTINLSTVRGDHFKTTMKFTDSQGTAKDITGWTFRLDVKRTIDDGVSVISLSSGSGITQVDLTGEITIILTPANSSSLNWVGDTLVTVYDLQATTDAADVLTPVKGSFTFLKDATV